MNDIFLSEVRIYLPVYNMILHANTIFTFIYLSNAIRYIL